MNYLSKKNQKEIIVQKKELKNIQKNLVRIQIFIFHINIMKG